MIITCGVVYARLIIVILLTLFSSGSGGGDGDGRAGISSRQFTLLSTRLREERWDVNGENILANGFPRRTV